MITNNFRLGVNDSFNLTQSYGYVNDQGIKQYLNPVEDYRTKYATANLSRITPWAFCYNFMVMGCDSNVVPEKGTCTKTALSRWFPSKYSQNFWINASNQADSSNSSSLLCLGSGTTPATPQDYALESVLDASFKFSQVTSLGTTDDTRYYVSHTLLITNIQQDSFTIGELGLYVPLLINWESYVTTISKYNATSNSRVELYLIERTVLDTPVTLAYNETASIDYRIVVNNSIN